jgi:hypothetical protein
METAVILMLLSVSLVPMVQMMGGDKVADEQGKTITDSSKQKMREVTVANSLMEQALLGNIGLPNFDLSQLTPNSSVNTGIQTYTNYNRTMWYDWTLLNQSFQIQNDGTLRMDRNGQPLPLVKGNWLASATLKVYPSANSQSPSLVFPTTLSQRQLSGQPGNASRIGIMLVLDTSGSMAWSSNDDSLPNTGTVVRVHWI